MDLSDRSLRDIEICINKLNKYHTGFDITAASDIMVILCLSKNIDDFIEKINNIVIGYDFKNNPVYVRNFNLDRSIKILAANLIKPNCLLTKENNLCLMHGGPFANIAHGCNSIIALNESFNYADYVVTEAGFGSDLGFEKFVDIIGREYNVPDAVVLCVTTKTIFYHSNKCKD
jgi:formate--tetrahydrofolate ligase